MKTDGENRWFERRDEQEKIQVKNADGI